MSGTLKYNWKKTESLSVNLTDRRATRVICSKWLSLLWYMLWAPCRGGLWALASTRKSWSCLPLWPPEVSGTFVLNIRDIYQFINTLQVIFPVDVFLPRPHTSRFFSFDTSICPELTFTSTVPIWSLLKTHMQTSRRTHLTMICADYCVYYLADDKHI